MAVQCDDVEDTMSADELLAYRAAAERSVDLVAAVLRRNGDEVESLMPRDPDEGYMMCGFLAGVVAHLGAAPSRGQHLEARLTSLLDLIA